jgi:hypothetical protein
MADDVQEPEEPEKEKPAHPHGGPPGQTGEHPRGGPPGQADKPDKPDKPDEPDPDAPEPTHPIVVPPEDEPHAETPA